MSNNPLKLTYKALVLILPIAGILVYSCIFGSPFVFDDDSIIVENHFIQDLHQFFSKSGYLHNPRRFVGYLSFALNYHFGGLNVVGYHVVNLVVHIASALLVFALVRMTFRTPFFQGPDHLKHHPTLDNQLFIPLFAALLFVVHPVQTQAVTYIVQRFASLATMFYLLSLVLYVQARLSLEARVQSPECRIQASDDRRQTAEDGKSRSAGDRWKWILLLAGATISAVLAMKTKEIAFTLPFAVLLYEFSFFRGEWKKRLLYLLPVLLTAFIVPLSVLSSGDSAGETLSDVGEQMRAGTQMSRLDYLFTQFRVIVTYLRLLLLPINQNLDYDYPLYTTFFTAPVFLSFLLLAGLFFLALHLYGFRFRAFCQSQIKSHESRLIGFGILWFFLTLSVESSLIPIEDVIFEHRLYLPSVGAFTSFAAAVFPLFGSKRPKVLVAVSAAIIIILGGAAWKRNLVWKDELTLWEDVSKKSPGKWRAHYNLGKIQNERGETEKALQSYLRAIEVNPNSLQAHNNLAGIYKRFGLLDKSIDHYRKTITIEPGFELGYYNLGVLYAQKGLYDEAIAYYKKALELKPQSFNSLLNLGAAYLEKGSLDDALQSFQQALRIDPESSAIHNNIGIIYERAGDFQKAEAYLRESLRLKPDNASAQKNLQRVLQKK